MSTANAALAAFILRSRPLAETEKSESRGYIGMGEETGEDADSEVISIRQWGRQTGRASLAVSRY